MIVEKCELEKVWFKKNLSLDYEGYFEENYHKLSGIIGSYCVLKDINYDNINPYMIISISDNHKSFVINRFAQI